MNLFKSLSFAKPRPNTEPDLSSHWTNFDDVFVICVPEASEDDIPEFPSAGSLAKYTHPLPES